MRRKVRESKRPRYNEDSEEDTDSIAAISKRLKAHQRSRVNSMNHQVNFICLVIFLLMITSEPVRDATICCMNYQS